MSAKESIDKLLAELCVEWGFCLPPASCDRIAAMDEFTPEEFAEAVLRAEGMDPSTNETWMERLTDRFQRHMAGSLSNPTRDTI